VHLAGIRLRDFRNYARLDAEFRPGFHLFLGNNAQGKTNILEAIYLLATLRSFRGSASVEMVRHGQGGYFVGATVLSDTQHTVRLYWSPQQRHLTLNGSPVRRLSEFLGVLRAVVFSNEDLELVKGPPSRRRRYVDLLLAQTSPGYLALLQRYTHTLRSRNALLKQPSPDETALAGFSAQLVQAGEQLLRERHGLLPKLGPVAGAAYGRIASDAEHLTLEYRPAVKSDFGVELVQARSRERVFRSTLVGPHRDELLLLLDGRSVDQFGSEGQKRSVAIALKMAQAEHIMQVHGSPPVLLIDDIMGELDARRRSAFVPLLKRVDQAGSQVFMTATEESWPEELGRSLQKWDVQSGTLRARG
jgi:DNA replication and repair protein RecF